MKMEKTLYSNAKGDIHFGINAPEGYAPCAIGDVRKSLAKLGKRKLWRCNVCNDMQLALAPPDPCPTCMTPHSYVEISEQEFRGVLGL